MAKVKTQSPFTGSWRHRLDVGLGRRIPRTKKSRRSSSSMRRGADHSSSDMSGASRTTTAQRSEIGKRVAQFCWDGEDGADGTPLDGIGWAILEGDKLSGTICIHLGDDSEFVAKKKESKR